MITSRGSTTTTVLITMGVIIVLVVIWQVAKQRGAQEASSTSATTTEAEASPESVTVVAVGKPIYYGPARTRAVITSIAGQDTGNAVINARIEPSGAQVSATANCATGSFTDFVPDEAYLYSGTNPNYSASDPTSPKYVVKDLSTNATLPD